MLNVDVVVAFCDCLSVHVHCSSTDINLSLDPNQKIPLCTTVACTSKLTFSCTSVIKRYKRLRTNWTHRHRINTSTSQSEIMSIIHELHGERLEFSVRLFCTPLLRPEPPDARATAPPRCPFVTPLPGNVAGNRIL